VSEHRANLAQTAATDAWRHLRETCLELPWNASNEVPESEQ
jgi:hypothetical protein